jgi:predicted ATPase/DNA-binding winged helix-turn-helix (wHTH) protein
MLSFPPFRLDTVNEQLWRGTELVALRPKTFAVLHHLAANPGRLVRQRELLQAVWGGSAVSDGLLRCYIRELRRVLDDDAGQPRFIATVSRRGYHFIAAVTAAAPDACGAPSPTGLFGRERELQILQTGLERARAGERQIVLLSGELGCGKTALLRSFLGGAGAGDRVLIAHGHCVERGAAGENFAPVLQALGALCRAAGRPIAAQLALHAPTTMMQIPGLLDDGELGRLQRNTDADAERPARMLRELVDAIEQLTTRHTLVLAIEDLQRSDPWTAALVSLLARRAQPARLMVIGSWQRTDVTTPASLTAAIEELKAHGHARELALAPLDERAVAEYLAARFPGHRFPAELHAVVTECTGGHPLFLSTLLDELLAHEAIVQRDRGWVLVASHDEIVRHCTASAQQIIDTQIEGLPLTEQQVLEAGSLAGAEFVTTAVAAALDVSVTDVDDCCDRLARRYHLLRYAGTSELPDGTVAARYTLRHALYRETTMGRVSQARRQLWRRRMGVDLASAGRIACRGG